MQRPKPRCQRIRPFSASIARTRPPCVPMYSRPRATTGGNSKKVGSCTAHKRLNGGRNFDAGATCVRFESKPYVFQSTPGSVGSRTGGFGSSAPARGAASEAVTRGGQSSR